MRLSNLAIHGFIGIKSLEVRMTAPVHLFCGSNYAGKSTVRDAVKLALIGNLGRVAHKKDAAQLVHDGAKAAACEVTEILKGDADGVRDERVYGVTITATGKIHESREAEIDPTLQYVLDAQHFATLDPKERRAFLFGLMRVRLTPASIVEKLVERGCDQTKIEVIAPLLRSGFDGAYTHARDAATQAKAVWRNTTGEMYGSVKGENWKAKLPDAAGAMDPAMLVASRQQLVTLDELISKQNQNIGALKQRRADIFASRAKMPDLRDQAAQLERLRKKLDVDKSLVKEMEDKVASASGAPKAVQTWACPCCAALLVLNDGKLVEHHPQPGAENKEAGNLAAYQASLRMCKNAVANDERDLGAAEAAQRQLAEIEAIAGLTDEEEKAVIDAEAEIRRLAAKKVEIDGRLDVARKYEEAVVEARKKTTNAMFNHIAVVEWDKISAQLSPDGIPAEILAATLTPINARMQQSSVDTGWPTISIDGDMTVRVGARVYGLLSESEQWRADAVVAEAISHISGRKLLVLDRMDVLIPPARGPLLSWLDLLARTGEIDTAIVCCSLYQRPGALPDTITAHWIVNGELVIENEAKAA